MKYELTDGTAEGTPDIVRGERVIRSEEGIRDPISDSGHLDPV